MTVYKAWGPLTTRSPLSETIGIAVAAERTRHGYAGPLDVAVHEDEIAGLTAPLGVTILTNVPGLIVPRGWAMVRIGGDA